MSSEQCLFCRIVKGDIPAKRIYEDEGVIAFHDIHPQAPVHVLVIPKQHVATLDDLTPEQRPMAGHLLERTGHVARELGLGENGYRVIINTRGHGGQEVFHIHVHILGGRHVGPMVTRQG
ncbi:MAG: histidine triad nucleotide-binding protein [Magnetococcales bacterium]|nr:histidine triad nucleotide-binding protein [Magnetococcales bacterium]